MLHAAADSGDPNVVDFIHTRLRDIESKTVEGYTPLMIAVASGKLQGVKYLLEKGANLWLRITTASTLYTIPYHVSQVSLPYCRVTWRTLSQTIGDD